MTNESNPITNLILAERQRQNEKWGKQTQKLDIWLLILQEEIGEVANAILEDLPQEDVIKEAVQVTAVAVQIGEWISEKAGWPATTEEVIRLALGGYKYGVGDPIKSFASISVEVGMIAAVVSEAVKGNDGSVSSYIRRIVFYGYELIYRLQKRGGVAS